MRPCWVLLLLLLAPAGAVSPEPDTSPVPGLEGAVTAGPEGSVPPGQDGSLPPTRPWRWPSSSLQAVLAALRLLHRGPPGPCALRLRVLQPWPGRLGVAQRQQELTFLVQDAWCQPTGTPPTACRSCRPQAVDSFNQRPDVQNAFRLLSADPEPAPGIDLSTLRALNFTIMETDCAPGSRVPADDCDFKENGAIKDCSGPVTFQQGTPDVDLRCTDASSDPVLVQRGRFGRFLGRIRRFRPRVSIRVQAHGTIRFG